MSFKRIEQDDFVISADSISATLWTGANPTLTQFHTSSTQVAGSSGNYYTNVYQTGSTLANAEIQFAIAYGNRLGSGSTFFNSGVIGRSPTATTYGQYQTLVIGDENTNFAFGSVTSSQFYAISIDRTRYKEKLFPGSLKLCLSGSSGSITLTDNSQVATSVIFNEAGRVYQIVSGSQGSVNTSKNVNGYSVNSGSYGWFLPDIATILLNPLALGDCLPSGGIGFIASQSYNSNGLNNQFLFAAISGSTGFSLNSEETISSDYIFVRVKNAEFNYSENPSFISGSTGEVIYSNFVNNPQVYFTTVGLYNETNQLLAVAKLSKPLLKDFTKEALLRVKLSY